MVEDEAESLRVRLADHWTELQQLAETHSSVDVAQAENMHLALFTALGRWDALSEEQRARMRDTVADPVVPIESAMQHLLLHHSAA